MKVVVGVGGQKMESAVREGNDANLLAPKSSFGSRSRDEQAGHVRKPRGFVVDASFCERRLLHRASGDVHGEKSAYVLRGRLNDGYDDDLAIGRP